MGGGIRRGSISRFWGAPIFQGRILAAWILAPKLPDSDLKIAVDFGVDFFLLFFQGKGPEKSHQKFPRKIHLELCSENFLSDFCRSLLLTIFHSEVPKPIQITENRGAPKKRNPTTTDPTPPPFLSREDNPPKKPPTQTRRVHANSLRKLFPPIFCSF